MIIDFHTHVAPPEVRDRPFWKGKCPMTIENVLEAQSVACIDRTIVSYPYHELREFDTARQLAAISSHNRYLAALAPSTTASTCSPARCRMAAMPSCASSSGR